MNWSEIKPRKLLLGCLLCLALATPAQADLIITGENATVTPGGVGTVDFMISSTNSDTIDSFNLQLQITTTSGNSVLQFTPSASQPDFSINSNYVFLGTSGGPPLWSNPTETATTNDTIAGGDFSSSDITITSSYLLAQVQFQADAGASLGDTFAISLVTSAAFTNFNDGNTSIAYTSSAATVTVTPEPATLALAGVAGLTGAIYSWNRRRKATSA